MLFGSLIDVVKTKNVISRNPRSTIGVRSILIDLLEAELISPMALVYRKMSELMDSINTMIELALFFNTYTSEQPDQSIEFVFHYYIGPVNLITGGTNHWIACTVCCGYCRTGIHGT